MQRIYSSDIPNHEGEEVALKGWVHIRRDYGKLIFIDLRDKEGLVQTVFSDDAPETRDRANELRPEWVVEIRGKVVKRPKKLINKGLPSGTHEVQAIELEVISKAETPPFELTTDGTEIGEEHRMKYRYLDLRRARMQRNLKIRHQAQTFIRDHLTKEGFTEVDTPTLTKATPEGARDFIVPSRLQPGKFYALPQSPQQYKQLLMVAGVEKYFQFPRCFRDEDPRADRAYGEFTQLDIEMSFVTQEDILKLAENLFTELVKAILPEKHVTKTPWPRLTHIEAMETYGTDKPDLRENKQDLNELAFSWTLDFPLFTEQSEEDFFHGSGNAKFAPSHHMFTSPHPDDLPLLDSDPTKVRGLQHDMVLNGFEVGGGSMRIHDPKIQEKIFDLIGFSSEQKKEFEHLLTAFTYGVPPHGGIAPGFDRFLMAALGEESVREVIPFPATAGGGTAVMDAPSEIPTEKLKELHLEVKKKEK